jgi:hypothetical protein
MSKNIPQVQSALAVLAHMPHVDEAKARLFKEFKPGQYIPGKGFVRYTLMAIVVDYSSYETVAYFDMAGDDDWGDHVVTSFRYEIVNGRFECKWTGNPVEMDADEYLEVKRAAQKALG